MPGRARWTPRAREELLSIFVEIGRHAPQAAERWFDRMEQAAGLLADAPLIGVARDDLKVGLRSFAVGNHLIFFVPSDDGVTVARVIDGRRDYPALFGEAE